MRNTHERQKQILKIVIEEYIRTAQPVSSFDLVERYKLDVCPATVRNDMLALTHSKYLYKPYTSSGRVPTTKGYKFFVEEVLSQRSRTLSTPRQARGKKTTTKPLFQEEDIKLSFSKILHNLAEETSNLMVGYLPEEKFLFEEGWKKVLFEPEFKEEKCRERFIKTIERLEEKLESLINQINDSLEVFIGKENPIIGTDDFSFIFCKPYLKEQPLILTLVGPKRMPYQKNIALMQEVLESFNNLKS